MTQGNDGFSDPLLDPPSQPQRDPSLDASLDLSPSPAPDVSTDGLAGPASRAWESPRSEDAVRRSGHGEAVFTHGRVATGPVATGPVAPGPVAPGPVSPGPERLDPALSETAQRAPRDLPVIDVGRSATPQPVPRPSAPSGGPRRRRPAGRSSGGIAKSGVPAAVGAAVALFAVVGVTGVMFAEPSEPSWDPANDGVVMGEAVAGDGGMDGAVGENSAPTPIRLSLPEVPVELRADAASGGGATVAGSGCWLEDTSSSGERQELGLNCTDPGSVGLVVVTVPTDAPVALVGGSRITVQGDLPSLSINRSTADVTLDDLSALRLSVATSGSVTGRINAAYGVDVLSRTKRVDLTFATSVRSTTIQAPRGEVSVQVPPRVAYDLDLKAGKGSVSSGVRDTNGAQEKLSVITDGHPITVATS